VPAVISRSMVEGTGSPAIVLPPMWMAKPVVSMVVVVVSMVVEEVVVVVAVVAMRARKVRKGSCW